jgi:hypothetical protein
MCRAWLTVPLLLSLVAARAGAQQPAPDPADAGIASGLAFLERMQDTDGSWPGPTGKSPAITGLAVLAFLSAGNEPGEGPYGAVVEKGVRWVLKSQRADGLFGAGTYQEMYHEGICTLMLSQVAGMTDPALGRQVRAGLEKGVALILKAQRSAGQHRGGWRYRPEGWDGDLSVTGWQLLALRAAKNLGCDVPGGRIDEAVAYVLRCRDPQTGAFCYTPGMGASAACTGTGILCLEVCGKGRHRTSEALQAGSLLLRQPPAVNGPHGFYAAYYGSQAMFQLGKNYWRAYRPTLHKELLDAQQANGCWLGGNGSGASYATAMAVLALTVEYRFLPIYQRGEDSPGDR